MKHPFYFSLAAITCLYLLLADWRGWSLLSQVGPGRGGPQGRSSYHK